MDLWAHLILENSASFQKLQIAQAAPRIEKLRSVFFFKQLRMQQ